MYQRLLPIIAAVALFAAAPAEARLHHPHHPRPRPLPTQLWYNMFLEFSGTQETVTTEPPAASLCLVARTCSSDYPTLVNTYKLSIHWHVHSDGSVLLRRKPEGDLSILNGRVSGNVDHYEASDTGRARGLQNVDPPYCATPQTWSGSSELHGSLLPTYSTKLTALAFWAQPTPDSGHFHQDGATCWYTSNTGLHQEATISESNNSFPVGPQVTVSRPRFGIGGQFGHRSIEVVRATKLTDAVPTSTGGTKKTTYTGRFRYAFSRCRGTAPCGESNPPGLPQ